MRRLPFLLATAAVFLTGCLGPSPIGADAGTGPRFVPEQWFAGRTVGRGEFRRVIGGAPTRFTMVVDGAWDGRALTLDETFRSRGGRWNRVWTIRRADDGRYVGALTTGRGPAAIRAAGSTVEMDYRSETPLVDRPFVAQFDQQLRLRPDGTVLNVADVYKWGVPIGRTTVVFSKPGQGAASIASMSESDRPK